MKGTRLVDVLDEKCVDPKYIDFWNKMFAKMNTLIVFFSSTHFADDANKIAP